ncbi:hypothetical protein DTO96_100926 [Ephemeroptericola cinctiostellae]|uniref:Uncharacterized protein n=1 Tax=Ephemeroptericola cinctiostellae TaxID=2268024 RepID=A0A345DA12_9BURK|nr:hypothetical protein DTO96_100926 [Ephemeroptericola cinctiostellae]
MTVYFGVLMQYSKGQLSTFKERKPCLLFYQRMPAQHDGHFDDIGCVIYLPSQATLILPSMMSFLI